MKKVAIITRTRNRKILLERAFLSVLNQSYKDYTWVIVNDGGEIENVNEIYNRAKLAKIDVKLIHLSESKGIEAASNKGIKNSSSKYIVIHDDDDSWNIDFLKETVEFMESPEGKLYGGVITWTTKFEEDINENEIINIKNLPFNHWLNQVYLSDMTKGNLFPPISFLYKREIYNKLNNYDETLPVLGDWDFNLRFLLLKDIAVIKKPLANYHFRTSPDITNEYQNTVVHGLWKHEKYDLILRNRYLREDINNNKLGLGFLTNLQRYMPYKETIFKKIFNKLKKWKK